MFETQFNPFVCEGDSIDCEVAGVTYTARLTHDWDCKPSHFDCYDDDVIEAWKEGEWHFFGLIITAQKDGVYLGDHLASLWGIEGNYPSGRDNPNTYFLDVANELLPEAIEAAKAARSHIMEVLAA